MMGDWRYPEMEMTGDQICVQNIISITTNGWMSLRYISTSMKNYIVICFDFIIQRNEYNEGWLSISSNWKCPWLNLLRDVLKMSISTGDWACSLKERDGRPKYVSKCTCITTNDWI